MSNDKDLVMELTEQLGQMRGALCEACAIGLDAVTRQDDRDRLHELARLSGLSLDWFRRS